MKRLSIQWRVTLWFTLLMTLLAAVGLGFLFFMGGQSALSATKSRMEQMAEDSRAQMGLGTDGIVFDSDLEYFRDGVYLSVYDDQGLPLYGAVPQRFDNSIVFSDSLLREVEDTGGRWYLYDVRCTVGQQDVWVRTVAAVDEIDATITVLLHLAVIVLPFFVVLAAVGGFVLTGRAFAPVRRITQTAREIGQGGDLSRRINLGPGRDEIHTLANEFDHMFARLEASFETEKQFANDASHELRTPTAVILTQCEDALDGNASPEELRAALKAVQRQGEKMAGLLSQLLLLARADSGRQTLRREPVDLSGLAAAVAEEQRELAAEKQISVTTKITPGLVVLGDETLLMRMLINLMENGIKYGRQGGRLALTLTLTGDADTVTGRVSDDGIGIAAGDLEKVWRRFWQADPARSRGGAGLGLSMVKWIVEAHGGCITVESTLGRGTVFTFAMPRQKAVARPE